MKLLKSGFCYGCKMPNVPVVEIGEELPDDDNAVSMTTYLCATCLDEARALLSKPTHRLHNGSLVQLLGEAKIHHSQSDVMGPRKVMVYRTASGLEACNVGRWESTVWSQATDKEVPYAVPLAALDTPSEAPTFSVKNVTHAPTASANPPGVEDWKPQLGQQFPAIQAVPYDAISVPVVSRDADGRVTSREVSLVPCETPHGYFYQAFVPETATLYFRLENDIEKARRLATLDVPDADAQANAVVEVEIKEEKTA